MVPSLGVVKLRHSRVVVIVLTFGDGLSHKHPRQHQGVYGRRDRAEFWLKYAGRKEWRKGGRSLFEMVSEAVTLNCHDETRGMFAHDTS